MVVNWFILETTRNAEECKKLLEEKIGKIIYNPAGGYISNNEFIGNVYKNYFTIRVAIKHLNSLSPFFIGKIKEVDGIVKIKGIFLINPLAFMFFIFFLLIVITSLYDKVDLFSVTFTILYFFLILICSSAIFKHPKIIKNFLISLLKN